MTAEFFFSHTKMVQNHFFALKVYFFVSMCNQWDLTLHWDALHDSRSKTCDFENSTHSSHDSWWPRCSRLLLKRVCNSGSWSWAQIEAWSNKSDNLQYNTLVRWFARTNDSSNKRLMFQVLFFFMISCKILFKNPFNLFSYFFYKITNIKIKSFECPKSIKSIKK